MWRGDGTCGEEKGDVANVAMRRYHPKTAESKQAHAEIDKSWEKRQKETDQNLAHTANQTQRVVT